VALDWDDLRYLLALGEAGSLAAAAKALKVDHSTMSRRLAALEASLGTKLVSRGPGSEAFLVIPPDLKDVARVKIVVDALAALFERERSLLAGEASA
jgi:hypothetical protein